MSGLMLVFFTYYFTDSSEIESILTPQTFVIATVGGSFCKIGKDSSHISDMNVAPTVLPGADPDSVPKLNGCRSK